MPIYETKPNNMKQFTILTKRLKAVKQLLNKAKSREERQAFKVRRDILEDQLRMCKAIHKIA